MSFLVPMFAAMTEFADAFAELTHSYGVLGIVFFVAIFIGVVLLFIPITPFSLAAGAIYGWWGIPIAYAGAVLGALVAFWIARGFGHKYVRGFCEKRPIARAIVQVMVTGGFRLVLLVRLSGMLPFAVQNYSFGLTAVDWRAYLAASMIGLVPGAIIKVWIGKVGMDVLHGGNTLADRLQTYSL
ncbi:MAG: VTT domain-containing protein, partial [Hyphomicrobiales bacterium]